MSKQSDRKKWSNASTGTIALLCASLIWGFGFVAQKMGMDYMEPFSFNGVRNLLGALVLLPIAVVILAKERKATDKEGQKAPLIKSILPGIIIGFFLFIASNLQQVGLKYTTVGKAGFITALYIVIVPILGVFLGKKVRGLMIISLVIAVVGLYLLCINESFSIGLGDGLVLLCALAFAFQILSIDILGGKINSIVLAYTEFLTVGILSLILAIFTETITLEGIWQARWALGYAAVFSSGVAYTLQIVGQKRVSPTVASLLMSLESVFSVLGGVVFMHEIMSLKEGIGCVLVFVAVIMSQFADSRG